MKIHSVISMIHLKQTKNDIFEREITFSHVADPDSIEINEKNQYVIEKIIKVEMQNDKSKYIIK